MAAAGMPAGGKLSFRITLISSRASASCTVQFRIPRSGSITPHRRAFTMTRYRLQQCSYVNILILLLLTVSPSWTFAQPPAGCNVPNVCVDLVAASLADHFCCRFAADAALASLARTALSVGLFGGFGQQGARIISMREPEEPRPGHPQTRRRRLGCRRQAAGEITASKGRDPVAAFRDCRAANVGKAVVRRVLVHRPSGPPSGLTASGVPAGTSQSQCSKLTMTAGDAGVVEPPQNGSRYDPIK